MGLHHALYEQMVRQTVAHVHLRIKKAVGVTRAAGIDQIVGVEDPFARHHAFVPQSRVSGFVFCGHLAVLDGVVEIDAEMEACGEMSDDELRLQADAYAPAVGLCGTGEVRLAVLRRAVVVRAVVEDIHASAEAEDTMRTPVGSELDLGAEERLAVFVEHLSRRADEAELYLAVMLAQGFEAVLLRRLVSRARGIVLGAVAEGQIATEDVVAGVRLAHAAVAHMIPAGREPETPAAAQGEGHKERFGEEVVEHRSYGLVDVRRELRDVQLFGRSGVVVRLGDERETESRSHADDEVWRAVERHFKERVRCYGVPEQIAAAGAGDVELPVTERYAHARIVPLGERLPVRTERDSKLTAERWSAPCALSLPEHRLDLGVRHDHTGAERETVVDVQSEQRQRQQQADEGYMAIDSAHPDDIHKSEGKDTKNYRYMQIIVCKMSKMSVILMH